jgi:hypothetical protein
MIPAWARWLMPSVGDIIFLSILLCLLGLYGLGLLIDADTGMHIRTGEYILDHGTIPKLDPFSYTKANEPWIIHSWLSGVLFALIHRLYDLSGVALLSAFTISFTYLLLFRFLIRRQVDLLTAVFLVIMVASTTLFFSYARPYIFTTLLVVIYYDRLERYRRYGNVMDLFLLPFLMILWVNLHGGYFAGFILIMIFLVGEVLDLVVFHNYTRNILANKKVRSFLCIGLISLLAALINPYGYRILPIPFSIASNSYLQEAITEWQSPSFHIVYFVPFELALLLLIVVLGRSSKRATFTEAGMILFWTHAALYSARHIPIFVVVLAFLIGSWLTVNKEPEQRVPAILKKYRNFSDKLGKMNRVFNRHIFAILALLFVLGLTYAKSFGPFQSFQVHFNSRNLPVQAAAFIKDVGLLGNMFNPSVFGGYLIYALSPDYKVFVDGRADMYGETFMKEYAKVEEFKPEWRGILDHYEVNWVIGHTQSALATLLDAAEDWRLIYSDETASVFIRDVSVNESVIRRYPNVKLKMTDRFL